MIRIGIIGAANIAVKSVIPAILELNQQFKLVGVASRSEDVAIKLAGEYCLERFVGYDSIIDNSIVDAIYIPLPNSLHYQWVKKSLEAGIHVLVEKSLGSCLEEVKLLCRLAEREGLGLIENFQFRFHPQLVSVQNLLSEKAIGEIRYIKSSFEFPPFPDSNNIRYQKDLVGGALMDAGAYPIKISNLLLGTGVQVKGATLRIDAKLEVDLGGGGLLVDEETGRYSLISFGFDNYYQCNLEIYGTKGAIRANRIFTAPPNFSPSIELTINGEDRQFIEIEPDNHFKLMLSHFFEVISGSQSKKIELNQNLAQARLLDEFKFKAND
jgi:NDP-hexose-3-ketoreductase